MLPLSYFKTIKERKGRRMNEPTNAQELLYSRNKLLYRAKANNYNPETIQLTWEEFDSIPCITEREVN